MLKPTDIFNLIRGMSQDMPVHITGDFNTWWYSRNARFRHGRIKQAGQLDSFLTLPDGDVTDVTYIGGFATMQMVLSGLGLYTLDFSINEATAVSMPVGFVPDTDSLYRWAVVQSTGGMFFISLQNELMVFDGTAVTFAYPGAGPNYKAKYAINFYNHLVLANVTDTGNAFPLRIAYSELNQFTIFEPLATNEADYFDLYENPFNSIYNLGITGIHKVGDILAIFTAGSIWNMRYVGFDNGVMQFSEQISGIGNIFPYSSVSMDKYAMFVSSEDFYVYDGVTATPVGGPIRDFFFSRISEDPDNRDRTWAFVDHKNQEIRWYYANSESTGECNECIVFNWQTKDWYFEDGQSLVTALSSGGTTRRTIDQLPRYSASIDGLDAVSSTIDGLDFFGVWPRTIFSKRGTPQLYSEVFGINSPLTVELESRDLIPGDRQSVKELDTILIQAEVKKTDAADSAEAGYGTGVLSNFKPPKHGWNVYISVRDDINDEVNYELVDCWNGTEPELRITKGRFFGRIFRFKFVSNGIHDSEFYGFSPNFNAGTTEK